MNKTYPPEQDFPDPPPTEKYMDYTKPERKFYGAATLLIRVILISWAIGAVLMVATIVSHS